MPTMGRKIRVMMPKIRSALARGRLLKGCESMEARMAMGLVAKMGGVADWDGSGLRVANVVDGGLGSFESASLRNRDRPCRSKMLNAQSFLKRLLYALPRPALKSEKAEIEDATIAQ